MMYLDLSVGYWVRRCDCDAGLVTGLAPVMEVHMNQSLDSASTISSGSLGMTGASDVISILDLTLGGNVELPKKHDTDRRILPAANVRAGVRGQFRFFVNYRF